MNSNPRHCLAFLKETLAVILGVSFLLVANRPVYAAPTDGAAEGVRKFRAGDFNAAAKTFHATAESSRADNRLQYNLGTSLLAAGDYAKAAEVLRDALLIRGDASLADIHYNRGVALADMARKSDPQEFYWLRLKHLYEAREEFRSAILANSADDDAKFNFDTVGLAISALRAEVSSVPTPGNDPTVTPTPPPTSAPSCTPGPPHRIPDPSVTPTPPPTPTPYGPPDRPHWIPPVPETGFGETRSVDAGLETANTHHHPRANRPSTDASVAVEYVPEPLPTGGLMAILNTLVDGSPDQYKKLYRFRGVPGTSASAKDW